MELLWRKVWVLESLRIVDITDMNESFFFLNDPPPPEFYPLPLHAALPTPVLAHTRDRLRDRREPLPHRLRSRNPHRWPIRRPNKERPGKGAKPQGTERPRDAFGFVAGAIEDRKSTRLNSSHSQISYAVFCL